MRIIAGECRGRSFKAPKGINTRPTLDRVREAVFGMLQFNIFGRNVLDLFAGSGAMGIEALSRGANSAVFCDSSLECTCIIKENLTLLGLKGEVYRRDFSEALIEFRRNGRCFDIVFLDPPYATDYINKALRLIADCNMLNQDGVIVAEHDPKLCIVVPQGFTATPMRKYGTAAVTIIKRGETNE